MENNDKSTFQFTYSAKDREEVKAIRNKYTPRDESEDKMALLRRLDAGVTKKATSVSLALGIIGALIMGMGMSLAMVAELALALDISTATAMTVGIFIGIVGIVLVCLAYPAYNRIVKRERERISPEIIRLTDELMK